MYMLELKEIKKEYPVAGGVVHALKGVSIKFRRNEFVSILGASGCGKTTLLNIIGGLDKYTSGDLIIEGTSTKEFKDGDWDTYRNHSIGFIFQSYHLIPHQTILQNVELALLISGVDREERRRRAIDALEKVGLGDKINARPNQLSGGQAQRVAIARALINDPEIVLADEPTGALDSKTSVQIMELLKEISRDRLVIMVTHNPELAEQYSTRIIRLLDGEVIDDTMPYDGDESQTSKLAAETEVQTETNGLSENDESKKSGKKASKGKKKKASMSMGMATSLSLKNLLSKGKRTAMVSVAGSIGIIGVSMVLAISAGVQSYIGSMQDDMLSGYPLTVSETAIDFNALMEFAESSGTKVDIARLKDKVYVDSLLETLMSFSGAQTTNNITAEYKTFVDAMPKEYYNALQYGYDFDMSNYIYTDFSVTGTAETTQNVSVTAIRAKYTSVLEQQPSYKQYAQMISTISSFKEIPDNYNYVLSQYDVLASSTGKTENFTAEELKDIFENKDSLIMVVSDNGFSDLNFGQYGYMTEDEFLNFAYKAEGSQDYDQSVIDKYEQGVSFDKFVGDGAHSFKWYPNDSIFVPAGDEEFTVDYNGYPVTRGADYKYEPNSAKFATDRVTENDVDMKVKVILQKKKNVLYGCLTSGLYYTANLTRHTIETGVKSNIAKFINEIDGEDKALNWLPYKYDYSYIKDGEYTTVTDTTGTIYKINRSSFTFSMIGGGSSGSQADILKVDDKLVAGVDLPSAFKIYPIDFEHKDLVTDYLDKWNDGCEKGALTFTGADGKEYTFTLTESDKVKYTDTVGLIITMVNTMIEMITIALIAFTALSLVVSTVMVGIITYVSVVERVKEIGILRAVGARKKDIKRLFNAETFLIGLAAGIVGIVVTYLISLILNLILGTLFGIYTIASLPWWQALVMVGISVILTLISGLIPAAAAAKKDPVVALRTE